MAKQRQTDVNINYKVNVAELERSEQLAKKAQATTDQLRQATSNFGKSASSSFQSASRTIEGMEIELARLRQQIKLTSTQDATRLNQLSSQYKALKQQVDAYNKSLLETNKSTKTASSDATVLGRSLSEVYNTARLVISAGLAREIVSISLSMAKLSGNVEGVERAFSRIPNSVLLLNSLREATHGTVTDLELMQRALMAQNFRIPLQNLGTLLEFAAVKAQQTGQEVNHLVDYIISGIGYRSIKRLDDLGFTANRVREALGGVSLQAASMGEVMTAVTKLMNEDLQKTGGFTETAATGVGKLQTAIHELNVEISKQGTNSQFIKFLTDTVDALRLYTKADFKTTNLPVVLFTEEVARMAEAQAAAFAESNKQLQEQEQLLDVDKKLYELSQTIALYKQQEQAGLANVTVLKQEVEQLREKNKSLFGLQMLSTEESKLIDAKEKEIETILKSNEALGNNKAVLAEVIKLVVDYRKALTTKVPDSPISEDDGNRAKPGRLNETINIDLKNPITGAVGKYDRDNIIKTFTDLVGVSGQILQGIVNAKQEDFKIKVSPEVTPTDEWDKIAQEFANSWRDLVTAGIMDTAALINSFGDNKAEMLRNDLENLTRYYDREIELAGDNENKKLDLAKKRDQQEQQLRRKVWEAEKEAKRSQTIINGAAGVVNAFATVPWPASITAALQIAANTAVQLAIISQQQYKGFAKGVIDLQGPGSKTSDSIPARLSRGESVMTADETSSSKGILKAVRAKRLNDKILKDIVSGKSGGQVVNNFDLAPVVKELKALKESQPDIVLRGNLVYEGRKRGDAYKQWVRSKSMSS